MIENAIVNTSRPWVEICLGPPRFTYYKISTNQSETGFYAKDGKFTADGTALITQMNIKGVAPQGREGSFSIKDLSGVWPNRFADIGRIGNDIAHSPGPDMKISFGWTGLKPIREQGAIHKDTLTAKLTSVKFDIEEDGAVSISGTFVPYSEFVFDDVLCFDWNDIINSDPEKFWQVLLTKNNNQPPTAIDVINYVARSAIFNRTSRTDNIIPDHQTFSFAKQLAKKKIIINCKSTGYKARPLQGDHDIEPIEFTMPLITWMNLMLAKVQITEEDEKLLKDKGMILTYRRQNAWYKKNDDGEVWTIIEYDWHVDPDPDSKIFNKDSLTFFEQWLKEVAGVKNFARGPVLFWKAGQEKYVFNDQTALIEPLSSSVVHNDGLSYKYFIDKKRVLNWESDLNSYEQLFRMFKDKLAEKYANLKENKNWEKFLETLKKFDTFEAVQDFMGKKPNWWQKVTSFGAVTKEYDSVIENYGGARELAEQLQAGNMSNDIPSRDQTLSSIIAQNTFKATVEIMGDPDIGTILEGGRTIMTTDFSFAGEEGYLRKVFDLDGKEISGIIRDPLIQMFSRQWILLESEHDFTSDGSYKTKMTLQAYVRKISPEEGLEAERQVMQRRKAQATGSAVEQ